MSEHSQNSQTEAAKTPTKPTEKTNQIVGELRNKKHRPDKFAVILLGAGECMLGEVDGDLDTLRKEVVEVHNPKRLLSIRQVAQGGLSVQYLIGDWDLVSGGTVFVRPRGGYWIKDLDAESQEALYGLFMEYLDRKVQNRAAEAGLAVVSARVRP